MNTNFNMLKKLLPILLIKNVWIIKIKYRYVFNYFYLDKMLLIIILIKSFGILFI